MNNLIEVTNLSKNFKNKNIINDVSFNVKKGEICGFIGPNGAGKTTIIKTLTGLIKPSTGSVLIKENNIVTDRENALKSIGCIVETPIFYPHMTGRKNLQNLAWLNTDMTRSEQLNKVEEVLEIVGLKNKNTDRGKDKVKTYSLGMKQRLGIAQALLNNPEIIILDEPANGLDPIGVRELRELIINLNTKYNITFFISSHLLDELQKICTNYVLIYEGSLKWNGKADSFMKLGNNIEDIFINLIGMEVGV